MTVKSSERKIVYIGNGTTSEFNVPFVFFKNTDIQVSIFDGSLSRPLEQDVDYTIEGAGDEAGGTVTTKTPVPNGYEIAIVREVPYTQEMEIPENDIFSSKNFERALDRLTQQTIQLKELADRAVTVGVFSDSNPSEVVGEIEALYDVKEQVVTAADNINAIVVAANDIEAIKDAPEQAASAIESAASAAKSADTCASYAQNAHFDAGVATEKSNIAVTAAEKAEKAAEHAVYKTVGEIFFTSRKGTLQGAVDADGSVYSFDAFTGTESVPSLLQKGELDYISFEEYESIVSANGSCRAWGWDNGDTFRVPTVKALLLTKEQAAVVGNGMSLGLNNGIVSGALVSRASSGLDGFATRYGSDVGTTVANSEQTMFDASSGLWKTTGITTDPEKSGIVANLDVIEYRAMVQLATGTTDEALITATSALQQIANKVDKTSKTDIETVVGWGIPDYSAGITITSGYTAPQKGLATVSMNGANHVTNNIYVNDINICYSSAGNQYMESPINAQISLDVGDKITWTGTQDVIAMFFPFKGV